MVSFASVVLLLLSPACADDSDATVDSGLFGEFARVFCELRFECACNNASFDTVEECIDTFIPPGTDPQAANTGGLHYDAECHARQIADLEARGCASSDLVEFDCSAACPIFYGDAGLGEPCDFFPNADTTCGQGLGCDLDGVCVEVCPAPVVAGDPCELLSDCSSGFWCDTEAGLCVAEVPEGGQCSSIFECASGTRCSAGVCVARMDPGVGEPCPDDICAPGADCDEAAAGGPVCVAEEPIVCFP